MEAKRGRPVTGNAMSGAERARRHRERQREAKRMIGAEVPIDTNATLMFTLDGALLDALKSYHEKIVEARGDNAPSIIDLLDQSLRFGLYHTGGLGQHLYRTCGQCVRIARAIPSRNDNQD